jgi:hypothetical protein
MKHSRLISTILAMAVCLSGVTRPAQAQQPASASRETGSTFSRVNPANLLARVWRVRRTGFSLMPSSRHAGASGSGFNTAAAGMSPLAPAVHGTGTVGKISMWVETGPSGNSILGDSIITQLNANIGVGLATPMSKLAVQGMIETTLGGYKFPDGTVQTTAAVSGLQSVSHDATLTGEGTSSSPLGVSLPLVLKGPTPGCCIEDRVLTVWNTSDGNNGLLVIAGGSASNPRHGGTGVFSFGGSSSNDKGGDGIRSSGGGSVSDLGGVGVSAFGGSSDSSTGGDGVSAQGGSSNTGQAGIGVKVFGGVSQSGVGGIGIEVTGGSSGTGLNGAVGVSATGGRSRGDSGAGGIAVQANGGNSNFGPGAGGNGVVAKGGNSSGIGGHGVVATGGDFNGRGVVATGGIGSVGYGVEATGGASTGSGSTAGAGMLAKGGPSSGPNSASGFGIFAMPGDATDGATRGRAGSFEGDVSISEHLTAGSLDVAGTKNFKIDHPLDPENKYLLHAAIESSEVLNVYSGNVTTDAKGEAVVTFPEWFEALNRDLRYQLTVIGTFAQAIVAEKVKQSRFTIKTSAPNVEVSWQVTGVRSDAMMLKHPFKAEENKPERERGTYISPEAFNKPEERGVEWARYPEMMRQLKQPVLEAERAQKQQEQLGRSKP